MLQAEKIAQAIQILDETQIEAWLLFARETSEINEPAWRVVAPTGVVWQSAIILTRRGEKIAIVGKFDDGAYRESGLYDEVIAYTQSIGDALRGALTRLDPQTIALDFSKSNPAADGLTYGMFLRLHDFLKDTPLPARFVSADPIISRLRGRKTPTEVNLIRAAIATTMQIIGETTQEIRVGASEKQLFDGMQARVTARGLDYAWDKVNNPIVNTGPNSQPGHTPPSARQVERGHIVHMDFGVKQDEYCADIQRVWYLRREDETRPPQAVQRAFDAVVKTIEAGARFLKPGVLGWQVDQHAREVITRAGYPEYQHAFGHQLGRTAHDGSTLLGPRWERYGDTPFGVVEAGQVFTLELGVMTDCGFVGVEEDVIVTAAGCEFLEEPQTSIWTI
jgi:Xaa-Pro aminopeptidase